MKNLQEELKIIQVEKKERKAQLEPLLEGAEKMLIDIDVGKGQVEQDGLDKEELLKDPIIAQTMETIAEKRIQVNSKVEDISGRF